MSDQHNVKQFKPGTTGQIVMTTSGGVVAWGNPLATTSAVGEVQLATQSQAWAGTPDTSGGNPLIIQPSGTLIRRNQTAGHAEIFLMSVSSSSSFSLPTLNARGQFALDLQPEILLATEIASGSRSIAIGTRNTAAGDQSFCIGMRNITTGVDQIAIGLQNNIASANAHNFTVGNYNSIGASASTSLAFGYSNFIGASNQSNVVVGIGNTLNATSTGDVTIVGSSNTSGVNAFRSGMFGFNNTGAGVNSNIFGTSNVGNDTTNATLLGQFNSIAGGGSTNTTVGSGNAIQSLLTDSSNSSLFGVQNVINSATNSIACGVSNNLQGGTFNQNLMAFGNSNFIGTPNASGGTNGAFGFGNTIGANSSRSWAFGESNSVTSLSYGNGGGIAAAFGVSNLIQNGEIVYLFGQGNQSRATYGNVFADYVTACGISNVFTPTSHGSSAFGLSNVIGGSECVAVGRGNQTGTGNRLSFFGFSNGVSLANPTNAVVCGNYNTVGSLGNYNADNAVIVGINNHSLSGNNVFGQGNFVTDHTFATGNGYNCNIFGSSNGTGPFINTSDIFGTNNYVGSSNVFVTSSPSDCISVGRNNSTTMNNTLQVGRGNIQNSPGQTATDSIFNVFLGNSNNIASASSYCLAVGHQNVWQISANNALAVGYKNNIAHSQGGFGGYSNTGHKAVAVGFINSAACDNTVAMGIGNFAGPGGQGGFSAASIAIGILNNNDRTQAFLNDSTGALTLNAFNLPVKNPGGGSIGTNSIAVGSENITSGLNSVAFGRHNDANGQEAIALGVRCQAVATQSTAVGCRAVARINNSINFGGMPLIRKDNGEALGTEMLSFAGTVATFESKIIDLKTPGVVLIQLPSLTNTGGARFWTDEVGIHVVSQTQIVSAGPYCSWGTQIDFGFGPTTNQKYKAISQMTGLSGEGTRESFTTLDADDGETSDDRVNPVRTVWLLARVDIAGVCSGVWTGRFYWKGRFIEQ